MWVKIEVKVASGEWRTLHITSYNLGDRITIYQDCKDEKLGPAAIKIQFDEQAKWRKWLAPWWELKYLWYKGKKLVGLVPG